MSGCCGGTDIMKFFENFEELETKGVIDENGQVEIIYLGDSTVPITFFGAVTHRQYIFSAKEKHCKKKVDKADALTNVRTIPGLLELVHKDGKHLFGVAKVDELETVDEVEGVVAVEGALELADAVEKALEKVDEVEVVELETEVEPEKPVEEPAESTSKPAKKRKYTKRTTSAKTATKDAESTSKAA